MRHSNASYLMQLGTLRWIGIASHAGPPVALHHLLRSFAPFPTSPPPSQRPHPPQTACPVSPRTGSLGELLTQSHCQRHYPAPPSRSEAGEEKSVVEKNRLSWVQLSRSHRAIFGYGSRSTKDRKPFEIHGVTGWFQTEDAFIAMRRRYDQGETVRTAR